MEKAEGEEGSRRSSTCQPGSVWIKYSEMLLVENSRSVAVVVEVLLWGLGVVPLAGGGVHVVVVGALEEADSGGDWVYREGDAESLTPVRRNLVCFCVCWLALWIGMSHSLQRIALSSWQNRNALLSYKQQT